MFSNEPDSNRGGSRGQTDITNQKEAFKHWRSRIFLTTWITYSAFYLCRVNMSIAAPGIMDDFGYSKAAMGGVMSALLIAYAIGQFINGQLGDKFGARSLITIGVLGSALLNIAFGFSSGITVMIVIWALNGYFQSMGWAPSVKTIANWFPPRLRGKMGGLLGSSYQIGNAYSWALAGFVTGLLGWRWAFWIPAIIFIIVGIHWYIRGRNAPEEVGLPPIEREAGGAEPQAKEDLHLGFGYTLKLIANNRAIWIIAFSLFWLNIVRYGFMSWAPTYMFEVQGATISVAAYKAIALPLAGSLGAFCAGWLTDKYFQSRRAPVAAVMLFLLGMFAWLYPRIPAESWVPSLLCLLVIGFMTYGPHILIVGIMPMDLGTRKASSSVAGFVDGFGYIGAGLTAVFSGWLIDNYSWNATFYFWVISAIIAGILMVSLWNYKPGRGKYF